MTTNHPTNRPARKRSKFEELRKRKKYRSAMARAQWTTAFDQAGIPYSICPDTGGGRIFLQTNPHIIAYPVNKKWQWLERTPNGKKTWHEGQGLTALLEFVATSADINSINNATLGGESTNGD